MKNKPSKLITKLLEQTKADAARIHELERTLDERTRDANAAAKDLVSAAVDRANSDLAIERLVKLLDEEREKMSRAAELRGLLLLEADQSLHRAERELESAKTRNAELEGANAELEMANSVLAARVADAEPQFRLLESQRQELVAILDSVRDRMRRKEREAESAILNRKVVAASAPSVNRRGQ
jgi:hypothetical protein